ncbi:transcriptional factor B3 [Striga asiatica]|uniref:Transcriptional factor B3 n=1 Tax=Striga asiatica TaxID=4170 RepID=A0A5A7Q397_STRAF|nr:transcriptional factor B3 [Striga asiatica]
MANTFDPFVTIITDASSPTLVLPESIYHQYTNHVTINCTIVTREHRTYEVWLVKVVDQLQFDDSWEYFVRAEDIRGGYILYFERQILYEFVVKVFTCNSVERPPQYRFFVEMKKTHVERARLAIPMSFWREHIEDQIHDTSRAILMCKGRRYNVPIIQGHGKALMEHGDCREFMDRSGIVEDSTCVFTLIGYECVVFKVRLLDA